MTLVCVPVVVCDVGFKSVDCGMARIDSDKSALCGAEAEGACCRASSGDVRDAFAPEVASALAGAVAESSRESFVFTAELVELSKDALAICLTASPWPNQFPR